MSTWQSGAHPASISRPVGPVVLKLGIGEDEPRPDLQTAAVLRIFERNHLIDAVDLGDLVASRRKLEVQRKLLPRQKLALEIDDSHEVVEVGGLHLTPGGAIGGDLHAEIHVQALI